MISIIVAAGENNEIGRANGLLWHLPADMKRFRQLTTGHVIVMGRKTYDSLPKGALPHRTNVVISRNSNLRLPQCTVLNSLQAALTAFADEQEIFIIGGAEIYRQSFPLADRIYLTRVHAEFPDADTFFPPIDPAEWQLIADETPLADETSPYNYSFYTFKRKRV
ncbi:MAG: dihydrofolate reductase [Dysgonamonadaceae bacterium]|nr:dihydrofolate reductase [Dysgonamonadaceae bacterium]